MATTALSTTGVLTLSDSASVIPTITITLSSAISNLVEISKGHVQVAPSTTAHVLVDSGAPVVVLAKTEIRFFWGRCRNNADNTLIATTWNIENGAGAKALEFSEFFFALNTAAVDDITKITVTTPADGVTRNIEFAYAL